MHIRSLIILPLFAMAAFELQADAQTISPGGIVNTASYQTPVAPGSIISVFGTTLAAAPAAAGSLPLPTALGGTSVYVNGKAVPLFYVSPSQINAQLPFETPVGTAALAVNGSAPVSFLVAASAPGILMYGNNRAVAINQDYSLNGPEHPAPAGGWVTVYMTGQGAVNPAVVSGAASPGNPPAVPTVPVTATIGGQPADVLFAGLTPGGAGLFQVNLRVPAGSGDLPLVVTVGGARSNAPLLALAGDGRPLSSVARTMVYHQLTALPDAGPDNRSSTVISGNGAVIAYTNAPGVVGRLNRVYAMNFDGTGDHLVDSYLPRWNAGSVLDISDDGSKIVSTDALQIRLVDKGAAQPLITLDTAISSVRISGDGLRVFFLVGRDGNIVTSGKPIPVQRGLYVMNYDGSGLRQIVGPNAVAALFGTTADSYTLPQFKGDTVAGRSALGVTRDGGRIVFAAEKGYYGPGSIFGVNLDGSGLHTVLGPVPYVSHVAISSGASKALYDISDGHSVETGVIDFDGSRRLALRKDGIGNAPGVQLSADGSLALAFDTLYNTDGSGALQLSTTFNSLTPGRPVMNSTATRFVYSFVPPRTYSQGLSQLASLEINPANLGAAPAILNASVNPAYAVAGGSAKSTLTARISPADRVIAVSYAILRDGLVEDPANADVFLADDGSWGDRTANDDVFTTNNVFAASISPAGPRLLRVFAQVTDDKGWRHGALVDLTPFAVVAQPPK